MLISDNSMTLQSGTGLPTATAITLVIDATDPVSGAATPSLKEVVTGTLSGTTVSNLLRSLDTTSAQGHASGANVVMWITADLWNDFQTSYLTQHTQLGTHTGLTTNTLTTSGNATVGGTLGVTGFSTLTGGFSNATMAIPYKFSVYRNAAESLNDDNGIVFDTVDFDTGSNYSASTGKFTAPVAGFYHFDSVISIDPDATTHYWAASLAKNGTIFARGVMISPNNTNAQAPSISHTMQLAANDYVGVIMESNAGGSTILNVGATPRLTWFSGFLMSQT
jgi:hypothetical protein